jgi:hypothetical protein
MSILCVGWFKINMEEFAELCNTISLKFERVDEVSYIHVYNWLMFLEMNLWQAQMCRVYVPHNRRSICKVDHFHQRVDMVPHYRLIVGDLYESKF